MDLVYSLNELPQTAEAFWKIAGKAQVIAFHGTLGAGKTTFIHALCESLHVTDVVSSPTFSIINEYSFPREQSTGKIFHIDVYRLKDEQEAIQAGVEDCFYSDHLCLVEWPEKIQSLLPTDTLDVFIETVNAETRRLKIRDN